MQFYFRSPIGVVKSICFFNFLIPFGIIPDGQLFPNFPLSKYIRLLVAKGESFSDTFQQLLYLIHN